MDLFRESAKKLSFVGGETQVYLGRVRGTRTRPKWPQCAVGRVVCAASYLQTEDHDLVDGMNYTT